MGLNELSEGNYYFYDFVQNIAYFLKICFLDIRKLVCFFLEQFDKVYLCKQYWSIYIFLPIWSL